MSHLSGIPESPLVPLMARSPRERRGDPQTNIEGGVDRTGGSPDSTTGGDGAGGGGSAAGAASGSGTGGTVGGDLAGIFSRLDALEAALDGASIEAHCNDDGTITVTLTLG